MRKIGFIVLFLATMFSLRAQDDVSFKVVCRRQVTVGEQFQVSYELNAEGINFDAPNFNNFEIVGGPFSSSSSSVQIVNGSVTRTNTYTYSYYLRAIREGHFTIPAASITVKNRRIRSNTADIEVVRDNHAAASNNSGTQQASTATSNVFLEAVPNKTSAYIGEQITLTYKIYYTVPISQLTISKAPS